MVIVFPRIGSDPGATTMLAGSSEAREVGCQSAGVQKPELRDKDAEPMGAQT